MSWSAALCLQSGQLTEADYIIPEGTRNDDKVTLCDALMASMIATTATASELELMLPVTALRLWEPRFCGCPDGLGFIVGYWPVIVIGMLFAEHEIDPPTKEGKDIMQKSVCLVYGPSGCVGTDAQYEKWFERDGP